MPSLSIASPVARKMRHQTSSNDSHYPIIQRPDENDSAVCLVWEEPVALEFWKCLGEVIRHRIKRRPLRCDVSYFRIKSRDVRLSSEVKKPAYDLAFIDAKRHCHEGNLIRRVSVSRILDRAHSFSAVLVERFV
jgi:hypothetical protein